MPLDLATYGVSLIGAKVGGGECTHFVSEALRHCGYRFAWMVGSPSIDYHWGKLITVIRPQTLFALECGDVLQFKGAFFDDGTRCPHHTGIVFDVTPTATYVVQQNFDGTRYVDHGTYRFGELIRGQVSVYRPQPRPLAAANLRQFTVTNLAADDVTVYTGSVAKAFKARLDFADTLGSWRIFTFDLPADVRLWTDGSNVTHAKDSTAYAIQADGKIVIVGEDWNILQPLS